MSGSTTKSFAAAAMKIQTAAKKMGGHFPFALRMIAEEILTDIKASRPGHGVPVKEGTLRSTGMVSGGLEPNQRVHRVEISFGGPAAPYALMQHERMRYRHPVGEARYLVRGLQRWRAMSSPAMNALRRNVAAILSGRRA